MGQQNRDLKPLTVYLPEDLIAKLRLQAETSRDSISAIVRRELMRPRVDGRDQPGSGSAGHGPRVGDLPRPL